MSKFGDFANAFAPAISNDWQLPQIPSSENPFDLSTGRHYGFLDLYTGYFRHVAHVENDVNQLGANAETMSPAERLANREQKEEEKWDEEYYMQALSPPLLGSFLITFQGRFRE